MTIGQFLLELASGLMLSYSSIRISEDKVCRKSRLYPIWRAFLWVGFIVFTIVGLALFYKGI